MARLHSALNDTLHRDLPAKEKMKLALEWLRGNPTESPTTAARIYHIEKEDSVLRAWNREKKKGLQLGTPTHGGHNKILRPEQHQAMIRYAADQATNGGRGATKQMMYNCAMWLRVQENKLVPSWRWFQLWLQSTPELHTIKTKPIASHRVDMHTQDNLREWFEQEYRPALEFTGIRSGKYIHNMDEKGARIACPVGEEVVVPIGIKEMYVGIPENRVSLTVIESISADGIAIPPIVIVPGTMIMVSWFHENMTGHEVVTVSPTGYTNEGICVAWLDHFIKHNNCGPDEPWHILLIDGATCHEAPEFVLKAKMNRIWIVKFPSHQTHLIQPLDVGCFRQWKRHQQSAIMNAIRSYEAEYNVQSFFRDLPQLREKTFTKRTIKHSFQNAGIWPVSFKAVKKKLKEYGKKRKRDTGLEFLEYGSASDSDSEADSEAKREPTLAPIPDPQLLEEYHLPPLPKPPSSYTECCLQLQEVNNKITAALSSPSRRKYEIARDGTQEFLMRGSLHEMEVTQARAGQIATHKAKLNARQSLSKGGSILASDALVKTKEKKRKAAADLVKRAKRKITITENKAKEALRVQGVAARKEEKARLQFIADSQALGIYIPPKMWIPVRDPQNNPTLEEKEALCANQSLYDALACSQHEYKKLQSEDPALFTDIPIDPAIIAEEQAFRVQHSGPLAAIQLYSEGENDVEDEESGVDEEAVSPPPRSVASIDSIAENADFISFEDLRQ
jgi:hypothetical protein